MKKINFLLAMFVLLFGLYLPQSVQAIITDCAKASCPKDYSCLRFGEGREVVCATGDYAPPCSDGFACRTPGKTCMYNYVNNVRSESGGCFTILPATPRADVAEQKVTTCPIGDGNSAGKGLAAECNTKPVEKAAYCDEFDSCPSGYFCSAGNTEVITPYSKYAIEAGAPDGKGLCVPSSFSQEKPAKCEERMCADGETCVELEHIIGPASSLCVRISGQSEAEKEKEKKTEKEKSKFMKDCINDPAILARGPDSTPMDIKAEAAERQKYCSGYLNRLLEDKLPIVYTPSIQGDDKKELPPTKGAMITVICSGDLKVTNTSSANNGIGVNVGNGYLIPNSRYYVPTGCKMLIAYPQPDSRTGEPRVVAIVGEGGYATSFSVGSEEGNTTTDTKEYSNNRLNLIRGIIKISPQSSSMKKSMIITTPNATVEERGTSYIVSYDDQKNETNVAVLEGSVIATPTNATLQPTVIAAEQELTVSQDSITPVAPLSVESRKILEEPIPQVASNIGGRVLAVVILIVVILALVAWLRSRP